MPETPSKVFKNQIDDLSLHLWRKLLVEVELFDDQVVIVLESLFHRLRHTEIEVCRDVELVESRVGLLHFLNPEV